MQLKPMESIFRVGRFKCNMKFDGGLITAEWEPDMPKGLSKKEIRQYRAGRDDLINEFCRINRCNIALIEA